MAKQDLSIPKLLERLTSEHDAYLFLEELRWDGHPVCPHCGEIDRATYIQPVNGTSRRTRTGASSQRRVWKCNGCRRQFSVLTGTIFHGTKISIRTWVMVVLEMCASKNGVSAREIERKYDLTPKTAWFMLHRIREAMQDGPLADLLRGTVVSDETWIGGKPSNRHATGQPLWAQREDKTTVLSLVNPDTGAVRSRVIADVTGATLRKVIADQVDMATSELHTDELQSYKQLGREFAAHRTVNHREGQYVRDGAGTNPAESYFSQLKRSLDGTHHRVSREHLQRYLVQFDFLRTYCKDTDTERMRRVIDRSAGRRLSYKPLTGQS